MLIWACAFSTRVLTWQDNRANALKVQYSVTEGYKEAALQFARGDFKRVVSDVNYLGHPPGYPLLLAGVFKLFGDSNNAIQLIQILLDSFAPILIFLIALELTPFAVATMTAVLASLSPQFSYFAVLLLPDSLVVLPLLLGFYLLLLARRRKSLRLFAAAGLLIGASCWLRANALLLAPFLALLTPLLIERGNRLRAAALLVCGVVIAIAPITIKNAIVFHRFLPLSLGAGQTLLEGLADHDPQGTLNIPQTDLGIMRQEAEWYGKPEYAQMLFGEDGIDRDRMRLARGFSVVGSHPIWFAGVVCKRAVASTRLDPVARLLPESPVSKQFNSETSKLIWIKTASELQQARSGAATVSVANDWLLLRGDDSTYGTQFVTSTIDVQPYHDYVLRVPVKLEGGRVNLEIADSTQQNTLAAVTIDLTEALPPQDQPVSTIEITFVSAGNSQVRVVIANNASARSMLLVGKSELFELGSSSQVWLRYLRIPIGLVQRIFVTAWMAPLVIIGIGLLVFEKKLHTIALLLAVPAYYLIVQSMLHTERRYVYVIHFFFLIFAATTFWWVACLLKRTLFANR